MRGLASSGAVAWVGGPTTGCRPGPRWAVADGNGGRTPDPEPNSPVVQSTQSARNTLVSCGLVPNLLEQNTSVLPSGENIGKELKSFE